ncbi:hypothetical protein SBF1_2360016 [Candidatus Desulfosporosinus infrequens]|uniref:PPC domain-containing protein n=1 Tax=Candidatus Desulfosporosinus infrequens TaxID=2043169 RepID=A0A2U3KMG0_9FIRM|nr:hypothetical protein SBF1_2360016 [Candidatus Desulfosporosinus infrequens]
MNSKVVVGPEDGTAEKPRPMVTELLGTSEAVGIGTLFINEDQVLKLHLHSAFGRNRDTVTGCTREGVMIWHIGDSTHRVVPVSAIYLLGSHSPVNKYIFL